MRLSYANVTATLAVVLCAGGTAVASVGHSSATPTISAVCVNTTGTLSAPTSSGRCRNNGRLRKLAGATGPRGEQGPAGPQGAAGSDGSPGAAGSAGESAGTRLTSPDGQFQVAVSNTGITLSGPGTTLQLTPATITATAEGSTTLTTGALLNLTGGLNATVTAGNNLILEGGNTSQLTGGSSTSVLTNGTLVVNGNRVNLGSSGNSCPAVTRAGGSASTIVFAC